MFHINTTRLRTLIVLSILVAMLPNISIAQTPAPINPDKSGTQFGTLRTNPPIPGPNQEVKIRLEAYGVDIGNARIIWSVDGVPQKEGYGITEFTTKTKALGEKMVVSVTAFTPVGRRIDQEVALEAAEVDILWEAQTYVPPFYKGKALPTHASKIKVTALPRLNTVVSDPKKYSYKWTINRTGVVGQGLGKNSTMIAAGKPKQKIVVGVEVAKLNESAKGQTTLDIETSEPRIDFYEDAPLLGVRTQSAIDFNSTIIGSEANIRAVPYYFSIDDYRNNKLRFEWLIDGRTPGINPGDLVTITNDMSGNIDLRIRNTSRLLQDAKKGALITLTDK